MSTALISNKFSQTPQKISFHMENKICSQWLVTAQNLQTIKTFFTLDIGQYCNVVVLFPQASDSQQWLCTATDLETPWVGAC